MAEAAKASPGLWSCPGMLRAVSGAGGLSCSRLLPAKVYRDLATTTIPLALRPLSREGTRALLCVLCGKGSCRLWVPCWNPGG